MAHKSLLLACSLLFVAAQAFGQCNVSVSASPQSSVCGDCVTLTAFGQGQGQQVFSENFNSGSPSGWAFTQQATYTNPCSPGGVNGTPHLWMGSASAVPRALETNAYNFSTATSGVTVCFDMLFAEQGDAAPCEGPDEPQEGVFLQYSTNNGATWITINYFDPNGGNDPDLVNWRNWCFQLPPGAIGPNTKIRWFQDADSGADYDHWGIDNVAIYYNDPTYVISYPHDGYSYPQGSSGGASPNRVCPQVTTDYVVVMTNGTTVCRDTVRLTVANPTIQVNAGNDTSICPGTCANLNGTAKVIKSAQQTRTYSNNEFQVLEPGTPAVININVAGLNNLTINPVVIERVCIGSLTYFGFGIVPPFTPTNFTTRNLRFELICPDGTVLLLLPENTISANNTITNTCFVLAGPSITTGATPYTGSFSPNQPFTNLNGCSSNGVWSLRVRLAPTLAFGTGFFFNWNITFNDPEISYPADITWSPTTNMTGSTTLTPQVCPSAGTTIYTLSATDTAGCVTVTDQVAVTVLPSCCNLAFTGARTNPTCGQSNGSITITPTAGVGPYTYTWAPGGVLGASRTGLQAGSYTITIRDNGQPNCQRDTTIVLTTTSNPIINSITPTPELCAGQNSGSIAVNASGGTGSLTYNWTPAGSGATRTNLTPGPYSVTVTDANGCSATSNTTLNAGPVCCTLAFTASSIAPTCGGTNGSITITVTSGAGNYTYAWTGSSSTTNTASGLGAGTYSVTVTDITQGCDRDTTISISSANAPTITNIAATNETCLGDDDGTATVTASGGSGLLSYEWNTNPTQTTASVAGLTPGNYSVTVTDALGCEAVGNVNVAAGPNCCNITYDIVGTNPACAQSNGAVTISNIGHPGYTFLWGGSQTSQSITSQPAGIYTVTITDARYPNCQRDTTITLVNPNAPIINNITATAETCLGDNDGSIDLTISGGTAPYDPIWSNGQNVEDPSGLAPGNYTVTVTDDNGCQVTGAIVVPAGPNCCNVNFGIALVNPSCGANNGSAEVVNVTGTGPYTYAWSNSPSTALNGAIPAGTYTVTVTDLAYPNCERDSTINLSNPNAPVIDTIVATAETCLGDEDGAANMTISGGTPPYTIVWSNAETTEDLTDLAPGNYTVTVTDDLGCAVTSFIVIAAGPQCCSLDASATTSAASCGAADGNITVTVVAASGTAPFEYSLNSGVFGPSNTFTVAGGNYSVTARDVNGCDTTLQVVVSEANNTILLSTVGTDPTCTGLSDGAAEAIISGGTAPVICVWSNGATTTSITNLIAGTYGVTVTDQTNCRAFGTITLTDPAPLAVDLGADWELCEGQDAVLDAGAADNYVWSTGDTTQTISALTSGTYSVTVTNAGGCTATDEVLVDVTPIFTVDAGVDTTIIQYESIIQLNGSVNGASGGAFTWTPTDFLTCDDCANPSLSPDSTTIYVLTYTTALGCSANDTVTVTVLPGEYFAILPNAFSPNGDGTNEVFRVYYAGVKRLVFRVHNRWGEKVFESDDKDGYWDGTYKGVAAQDGVYVWDMYVEFLNTKIPAQRKKGSVLLLK